MSIGSHLDKVLESNKMKHVDSQVKQLREKRDEVISQLREKLNGKLTANPIYSGSYAKNTAVNIKFDMDLCVPFTHSGFSTLDAMHQKIFDLLNDYYNEDLNVHVRKQKTSVGITYLVYDEDRKCNSQINLDIVPGRELSDGDYKKTFRLNLNVIKDGTLENTYTQTNVKNQIEEMRKAVDESPDVRRVIRLLKIWKVNENFKVKSFLLELIVFRAFDSQEMLAGLWPKLKTTMEYIRDKIETINLEDPGNSANNVADTMSSTQKTQFARRMRNILNQIERDEEEIDYYFPINKQYDKTSKGPAILVGATGLGNSSGATSGFA